jgi:hypothetical protein
MRKMICEWGVMLLAGMVGARPAPAPAGSNRIQWVSNLATAQHRAQSQQKLVMQFLMLGDLPDPHC